MSYQDNILTIEHLLVYGNMPSSEFYKTAEWRKARYHVLTHYGNRCQLCGIGADEEPLQVDHIKPRSLYPDLCLSFHNLQVLCRDCNAAKSNQYLDDFREKFTKVRPVQVKDVMRIRRKHLALVHEPPKSRPEVKWLTNDVICTYSGFKTVWKLFVKYCFKCQKTYGEARLLKLNDATASRLFADSSYSRLVQHKELDDFVFDISGIPFPPDMHTLLVDEEV